MGKDPKIGHFLGAQVYIFEKIRKNQELNVQLPRPVETIANKHKLVGISHFWGKIVIIVV